jgi:hypothetical protein
MISILQTTKSSGSVSLSSKPSRSPPVNKSEGAVPHDFNQKDDKMIE